MDPASLIVFLATLLHFAAFILDWFLFLLVVKQPASRSSSTGAFLVCNYLLTDVWKLLMAILYNSSSFIRQSDSAIWILPYMAPIFTYLSLPMLLLNSLSQIKNPVFYLQFQKNLMRFATAFVWLLGSAWCAILVTCYLADFNETKPFTEFLVVIHVLSVAFCVFIVVDMVFHKWKGRRRIHHRTQPLCYHCVTSSASTSVPSTSTNQRPLLLVSSMSPNSPTNQISAIESNNFTTSDVTSSNSDILPDFVLFATSSVLVTLPTTLVSMGSRINYDLNSLTNQSLAFLYVNPLCSIGGVILYTALRFDSLTNLVE